MGALMETISIRPELKALILEEVASRGLSPSDVIEGWRAGGLGTKESGGPVEDSAEANGVERFLSGSNFRSKGYAIDRYLALLSFLYEKHGDALDHITSLRGHRRRYFATDEDSLRKYGVQVNPKRVPGTPYWAMSRLSNRDKREILTRIMKGLGYGEDTVRLVRQAFPSG